MSTLVLDPSLPPVSGQAVVEWPVELLEDARERVLEAALAALPLAFPEVEIEDVDSVSTLVTDTVSDHVLSLLR